MEGAAGVRFACEAQSQSIYDCRRGVSGEVLKQLQQTYPAAKLSGFDISPQAISLAKLRERNTLTFHHRDVCDAPGCYDVLLALDVFEHVEDYFGFLRSINSLAILKIFHIPLDMNVIGVLRRTPMTSRASVGHLHYFSMETAIATLQDCGYQVLDWRYTLSAAAPGAPSTGRARALTLVRRVLSKVCPNLAARTLGGFSMLVLAR
ncbi:class I SAM-dependent methyltransferase [Sphingomonas sp. DT-207]|uniref:class I SAM-dependent methyltransferase n=1 Tax=Sphingomonas sp. DT-207 TaxID=3396167 RepID=UPI003F1CC350